jgi:pimeloyl-ACP methyl ester carboxylesterase
MDATRVALAASALLAGAALGTEGVPEPKLVRFPTSDGQKISAFEWGAGKTALILCHGKAYTDGGASFARECAYLAAKGIRCLALNFRGYPADAPPALKGKENDVLGALGYLATHGAERIFVLGSSMGGFTALAALDQLMAQPQFAGLIVLSAMQVKPSVTAACPKLFFCAEDDARLYPYVQMTFYKAATPKQAVFFKGGGHGQQLFRRHGQRMVEQIALFIQSARPAAEPRGTRSPAPAER